MTHQVSKVSPEFAPKVWPQIEGFVEKALRKGHALNKSLPVDILGHIIFNHMHLWVAHDQQKIDAAIVTRFIDWDRCRTLYVPIIGGRNLKAWLDPVLTELDKFAKANNCIEIGGELRKGWARVGGFEITGCTLQRNVT